MILRDKSLLLGWMLVVGVFLVGCDQQSSSTDNRRTDSKDSTETTLRTSEQTDDNAPLGENPDQDNENLNGAKQWLGDQLRLATKGGNDAAQAASNAAGDTLDWATATYKRLKEQGLTTADSASQWIAEDFKSMGAWEYKILEIPLAEPADGVETQLNELGNSRWDCFQVTNIPDSDSCQYYFKRPKKSYLKSIPMKDLIKLIPLIDGQ